MFPVVDGIPVLMVPDGEPMYPPFAEVPANPALQAADPAAIDPFVQQNLVRTNGKLYRSLRGKLKRYPIPELPLPAGEGRTFLDVGSNWGRWTIAAARKGYRAVGMDVSLAGVRAARRVARQLGVAPGFIVADSRRMPFLDNTFEVCFSYSVLQQFEKKMARQSVEEIARVAVPGGRILVQMANRFGLLQMVNRAIRPLRRNLSFFHVRYWTPRELRAMFNEVVGPSRVYPEGFFSLDAQGADLDILPWPEAAVVRLSEKLCRASRHFPPLAAMADSVYVDSLKRDVLPARDASPAE
ncbi:MAG: class I SAM-dependent methyltransferase [Acidobacteriia bacterium]|nr:class I SAM-dependent methyltransferase [Terriglobia bacterium]